MAVLGASERDAIAALLAKGDVRRGFERIAAYPDLKQNDLRTLDKAALARLGGDVAATRAFVAGLLSPSSSVRRMARKYAPKLTPHGPGAVLLLLAEAVQPLRRLEGGDGLAGDFDGFATPLGPAVVGAKLSFEIKNPTVAVYSPATRLIKDALEDLAAAVQQTPDPVFLRAVELVQALARPFARVSDCPLQPELAEPPERYPRFFALRVLGDPLRQALRARARKDDPATLATLERWARHEVVSLDPAPAGSPEAALGERLRRLLPGAELASSAAILAVCAADLLQHGPSRERALALYWHLKAGPPPPSDAHAWLLDFMFGKFERENPRETSGQRPAQLPELAPPGARDLLAPLACPGAAAPATKKKRGAQEQALRRTHPSDEAPSPAAAPPPPAVDVELPLAPHLGPPLEHTLFALMHVAHRLGLPRVWRRLTKDTEMDEVFGDDDAPARGRAPAHAEDTVEEARTTLRAAAIKHKGREALARANFGHFSHQEAKFVPEAALEAPWAERLAPLLAGLVETDAGAALCGAMLLLPPRLVAAHVDAWRQGVTRLREEAEHRLGDTLDLTVTTRALGLEAVLGPVLEDRARRYPPNGDGTWQYAVALLYLAGGDAGRAAALRAIDAACVPQEKAYARRHHFNDSYRFLVRRAWERRDADLLGVACSRVLLPMYFKGKRAFLPDQERLRYSRAVASTEGTAAPGREVPLAEVVAFVARERPALLAAGLAAAGTIAADEKGARALLDVAPKLDAASPAGDDRVADVVALLEAPTDAAVKSGLDMLVGLTARLGDRLDQVVVGLERAVTSASPGVVQAAAKVLGSVAEAHPARREDAVRLLEECLMSPNVPTAEEAMRALVRALGAPTTGTKKKPRAPAKKVAKKKTSSPKGATKKGATASAGPGLSAAARERIAALAEDEPKRLGKLAAALLG